MKINGACHCGYITIEGEADPEKVGICHCTDCQIGTGSAFRVSIPVPGDAFKMTGQPTSYLKTTADSGNPRAHGFCPDCGTPLWATSTDASPSSYGLRVGTLDCRAELKPSRQGWFRSALPWSQALSGVTRVERQ